jgi:hypothetical protein
LNIAVGNRRVDSNPVKTCSRKIEHESEMRKTNEKTMRVSGPRFRTNILFCSSTHRFAAIISSAVGCGAGAVPPSWV